MRHLAIVLCLLLPAASTLADGLSLRRVFEETATAPPERYRLGREMLIAAGGAAARLASDYVDDPDPRLRALAEWLHLRRDHPEHVEVWEAALASGWIELKRDTTDIPRAIVRFPRHGSNGQRLEIREVLFWPRSKWLLVDAIRRGRYAEYGAARIAGVMEAAEAAPFLVSALGRHSHVKEIADHVDALVAIGPASLPFVRPALEADHVATATAAATVVGRLADTESADALLERIRTDDDHQSFSAAAEALRNVAPERAAEAVLARLIEAALIEEPRRRDRLHYAEIRGALLPFGEAAHRATASRQPNATIVERALLAGLAWELADADRAAEAYRRIHEAREEATRHPIVPPVRQEEDTSPQGRWQFWHGGAVDGAPLPLVRERAAALADPAALVALVAAKDEGSSALVRIALGGHHRQHGDLAVFAALVDQAPDVALDALDDAITGEPPRVLPSYVASALLALEQPRAREVLERIAGRAPDVPNTRAGSIYARSKPIAEAGLAVIHGQMSLEDLVGHESPGVGLAAARALARRNNAVGVPLLAEAAVGARGAAYASLRDDLVRAGVAPEPKEDDVFRTVLREAVAFRVAAPERARDIDREVWNRPHIPSVCGPQPGHYVQAGHALADEVGPDARPLLEEAALFQGSLIAIHALGRLAADASIPVLLRVSRTTPGPAADALRAMGEKGMTAAREVPLPDPDKADFHGRGCRHVAAADTLVGEEGGVEKILGGLRQPCPMDPEARYAWETRMARYLSTATRDPSAGFDPPPPRNDEPPEKRTLDPRLLEPALMLLQTHGQENASLRVAALWLLAHYQDERIAEAALPWLPLHRFDHDGGPGYAALRGALGARAIPFLLERVDATRHDRRLHTLWRLMFTDYAAEEDRNACAARLRIACLSEDAEAAGRAATDLLLLHTHRPEGERDARDLDTVLRYVVTHGVPGPVVHPLVDAKLPGTAEALFASYQRAHDRLVLRALATFRYEPAADDVHQEALRRIATEKKDRWRFVELGALAHLGERGLVLTRPYLESDQPRATRVAAAAALGEVGDGASIEGIVALLLEMEPDAAHDDATKKLWDTVLWAATGADARRAHRVFMSRALFAPDPLRGIYARRVPMLRARLPSLRDSVPVPTGD